MMNGVEWTALGIGLVVAAWFGLVAFGSSRWQVLTQAQMAKLEAARVPARAGRYAGVGHPRRSPKAAGANSVAVPFSSGSLSPVSEASSVRKADAATRRVGAHGVALRRPCSR